MSARAVVGPVAWANLKGHRIQAVLIAVTLAACGGLATFGLAAQAASGNAFDRLWRATNGADLWVYIDGARASSATVERALAQTPGIAAWTPPQIEVGAVALGVAPNAFSSAFVVRDWPEDVHAVGHPVLVAGTAPRSDDGDVLVLDLNVARASHLGVGSTVGIPTPAGVRSLRVVGLEADAENCPYPLCGPQTLFVAPHHLATLGLPTAGVGQLAVAIRITRRAPGQAAIVRDAFTARLPPGSVTFASIAATTRQFASLGYATQSGLLLAFAIVAAIASILLIVVAIGGAVRADSRRVGLLKAVGFSTRQLRAAVLAEYLGIATVGAVVGTAAASVVASRELGAVTRQYATGPPTIPWRGALVATAGVMFLVAIVVLAASRRSVRLDAVSALRSDAAGSNRASALLPGPVMLSRAVGDIASSRLRSALTATVLAVAAGALVMSALFESGLRGFVDRLAFDGARRGDLVVRASDQIPPATAMSALRTTPGVAGVVVDRNVNFSLAGSTATLVLRLRSGDLTTLPQSLVAGRGIQRPGEAVVGYGLARKHHVRPGDNLRVTVGGMARTFQVVGINREINNLGEMATTLDATIPGAHPIDQPVYLVHVQPGADARALASRITTTTRGLMQPSVVGSESLPPVIRSISPVITALAAMLALLTALGVFNSVLLAVQERRREFGLVRAVGMSQRQVIGVAATGTVLLAVAACVVAVPFSVVAGRSLLSAVQRGIGVGPLSASLPATVLAVGPAVIAVALAGALGPAWSASRTTITAVLRDQ